ncbi:D-alanyl-D-alanine carboxypeptidase family protein [Paenibacillus sp. JX-17]|uniref:D-alanyl-D-alanine carboxypeptidase family protein n=1 Tax=Paenibacillus lacisoli TaxID=3064525 RepID=A0ABT9CAA2_9BACL|nr:D-alanyl-D-alanine carboxypeptidase family protein [Paenibacillus sp. JX-17]MDO7906182.1 D-alanyl-D-alanine carboxypeptidase family protein [Paenibacillus sp. JX-17]
MTKKWIKAAAGAVLIILIFSIYKPQVWASKPNLHASSAVLLDMNTGKVMVNINGQSLMPTSSMAKLMTELLILEDVRESRTTWGDPVTISRYASSVGGMNLSLHEGDVLSVRDLFESVAVYSANDAAVALAEHSAGTEAKFVRRMNEKAAELKLVDGSYFANASGLSPGELGPYRPAEIQGVTRLSAADTARLASYLISNYPEVLKMSSQPQLELSSRGLYLSNGNLMLPTLGGPYSYAGTDGLKTGYSFESGYCFTGTAERDGTRLVAVVMGASTRDERFNETRKLFDYGFAHTPSLKERFMKWFDIEPETKTSGA